MFVLDKPFEPVLMFAGKARAYLCDAPFRCFTIGLAPGITLKDIDLAGKDCQGQTL